MGSNAAGRDPLHCVIKLRRRGGAGSEYRAGLEQSPDTRFVNWSTARHICIEKNVGGQNGFRLPSIVELSSLMDPGNSDPSLPTGHLFSNVEASLYWSASLDADVPLSAWYVDFLGGRVNAIHRGSPLHYWCVRGGMNADQY